MMLEKNPEAARFGAPGRTQMVGSRTADAVDETAARVVGQQQLGDRLLGAVARQRGELFVVADHVGERCAKDRDRRGDHDTRHVLAVLLGAQRVEQQPRAVEIDAVALVEVGFGLARTRPRRGGTRHRGGVDSKPSATLGTARSATTRLDVEGRRRGSFGSTMSASVTWRMGAVPSAPSRARRSTSLWPSIPAAPRTKMRTRGQ